MASCSSEDFRNKQVVNVCDGKCLGNICEIEFDVCDGKITAIVVEGEGGFLGFGPGEEYVIPWDKIQKIGEDVVLVDGGSFSIPEGEATKRRRGKV